MDRLRKLAGTGVNGKRGKDFAALGSTGLRGRDRGSQFDTDYTGFADTHGYYVGRAGQSCSAKKLQLKENVA